MLCKPQPHLDVPARACVLLRGGTSKWTCVNEEGTSEVAEFGGRAPPMVALHDDDDTHRWNRKGAPPKS